MQVRQNIMLILGLLSLVGRPSTAAERSTDRLCGANCLYVAMISLEVDPGDYDKFLESCGEIPPEGLSLGRLQELAESRGLKTLGVETNLSLLSQRKEQFACIAHLNEGHFVLIAETSGDVVSVVNPPIQREIVANVFSSQWSGKALLLSPNDLSSGASSPQTSWLRNALLMVSLGSVGVWGLLWYAKKRQ